MNIFVPLPSVFKVIIYLKNKTAAVDAGSGAGVGVGVGGAEGCSVLYPGKDSQNGSCFPVNSASQ